MAQKYPVNVSLDEETHKLAKAKGRGFSRWVRDQLRNERNKKEEWKESGVWWYCKKCDKSSLWPKNQTVIWCKVKHCMSSDMELVEE